ncbi:hypothetical protein Sru01_55120 [Sphaerisporangium rufum]|uniref:M23ase beta-sheet core domain-containing protein n=1 Tax=Sphaerisporangium rufum TaxID=1381558 RepID=A0A919R997_9ACTN|nr:M23 family metallopeptidase [Sphaerisporangium rufum]GII80530.1 hypothetical protein Sru01_55120 [Sphaerisporangium rufum]
MFALPARPAKVALVTLAALGLPLPALPSPAPALGGTQPAAATEAAHRPPGRVPASGDAPGGTGQPARRCGPRWCLPLDGPVRVLRRFAPPAEPWLPGHRGVDLAGTPGRAVRAAGAGVVGYAGPLAGRGVVMIVHPDGLRTTYLPVHATVRRGRPVARGQVIGTLEAGTGHCPTSCLHWGLIDEYRYLDALLLVGFGQVRLLPHRRSTR